eukprot:3865868-Prymnesium_polylepis.1
MGAPPGGGIRRVFRGPCSGSRETTKCESFTHPRHVYQSTRHLMGAGLKPDPRVALIVLRIAVPL